LVGVHLRLPTGPHRRGFVAAVYWSYRKRREPSIQFRRTFRINVNTKHIKKMSHDKSNAYLLKLAMFMHNIRMRCQNSSHEKTCPTQGQNVVLIIIAIT